MARRDQKLFVSANRVGLDHYFRHRIDLLPDENIVYKARLHGIALVEVNILERFGDGLFFGFLEQLLEFGFEDF